jgi:hypothetical protein
MLTVEQLSGAFEDFLRVVQKENWITTNKSVMVWLNSIN